MLKTADRYPAGPLVAIVGTRPIRPLFGQLYRAYYRGRARGWYPLNTADRLAVRLGHHIDEIWPTR